MAIVRIKQPTSNDSASSFESESAAKDWLSNDGLLNIEKILSLSKKVEAALKKVSVEAKPVGRGGRTVQFDVVGKKTSISRVLRGRFPRNNADGVSMDVSEVPRQDGVFRARIQVPAGQTISPKLRTEVAKLLNEVQEVKPTQVIAMSAKAKTAKFTAANDKKKENFTYRSRRAVKVAERTRETATSKTLVRVFPKGILTDALHKQCQEAFKAAQSHIKKIEKVKSGIQKDREKVRDQKAADYVKVVDEVMPMLEAQGISASKMVLGKTMMGAQTLYVQLPSKRVITIGLSDVKAMRSASKLSSESSSKKPNSQVFHKFDEAVVALDKDLEVEVKQVFGNIVFGDMDTGKKLASYNVRAKTLGGKKVDVAKMDDKKVQSLIKSIIKGQFASESSTSSVIGGVTYPNKLRAEDKMALLEVTKHVDGSESHKYALPDGYLTIENVGDDFGIKYQSGNRPVRTLPLATLRALLADLDFSPRDSRTIYHSFLGKFSADTVNRILGGSRGRPWGEFQ